MQDEADRPLVLVQYIATQWRTRTRDGVAPIIVYDEQANALSQIVPDRLDFPSRQLDGPEREQDQAMDILYHCALYEELNHYQEPSKQFWTARCSQLLNLLPQEEFVRKWLPPDLTVFSLPAISGQCLPPQWRLDLSWQGDALLVEFWGESKLFPHSRYPTGKRSEVILPLGEWGQMNWGILGSSRCPEMCGAEIINVGHVRRFTPTLFRERPPTPLTRFSGGKRIEPAEH